MRAYILHLARATARRGNAEALLETCGVAGEIWPAVDGAAMAPEALSARVGKRLFAPHYPFELRLGEIGCFLSHRAIWADFLASEDETALILEDDAGLEPDRFAAALALARIHVARLGYVQLQTRPHKGAHVDLDHADACKLILPQVAGLRTTAQVVSRAAAARLLERSERFDRPVDTFIQSHWHTGLRPAMIFPSGVLEIADQLEGSTIQSARKSLWEKLRREAQRSRFRAHVRRLSRGSDAAHA